MKEIIVLIKETKLDEKGTSNMKVELNCSAKDFVRLTSRAILDVSKKSGIDSDFIIKRLKAGVSAWKLVEINENKKADYGEEKEKSDDKELNKLLEKTEALLKLLSDLDED